ncbi:MAG: type IV pili methyl-accepting chemotaxis transducer N-terminal domain-containing protein [Rhodocyclaceae bacterium]|nr:type IV pili methyl-accepting chemotaxis transducer N-terminal domain-containing protein [Rhodocyclaceae bacterium]
MAFKLPAPSILKGKEKSVAPKTAVSAEGAAAQPVSSGFFARLFGGKKKTTSSDTAGRVVKAGPEPATGVPVGNQTQKIAAIVAANKVEKPKLERLTFVLPLLSRFPMQTQFQVLGTLAGLFFALMLGSIAVDTIQRGNISTYTNIASQLQFHTQRLAKSGGLAARGDQASFVPLQDSRDEFQKYLEVLNSGGFAFTNNVPSARSSEELISRLTELTKRYQDASNAATAILAAQKDLTNLGRNVAQVRAVAEELSELSQQLASTLQQSGVNPAQVLKVNRLTFLAERLARGAADILGAEVIDPEVPFLMGKSTNDFRDLVKALEGGSESIGVTAATGENRARVVKLREVFTTFEENLKPILENVQKLVSARQAGRALQQGSEQLLSSVEQLQVGFAAESHTLPLIVAAASGLLMLVFLGLMGYLYLVTERRRATDSELENKRNQEAILRLLNEMGDLADGDLTIRAKVTEDITGAIADSMNYTVDELRTLVTGVNNASTQVSAKTQQAQAVSVQLLDAADKQSREIQSTTEQVLGVAKTLSTVSTNAEESSRVALRSLAASDKGRVAVQNSIASMNDIREQIQETSKRIKRLGESSQEIGEIVELISDITEQTNVLALNAAIQAASAGEAGRGFSVVAEEVQRLAERSAEATKQIGAIVKTIQADTQDAVAAMEKSTTGVVEGAKLSDAAGQALSEIDSVTTSLAALIQKISSDTQIQAASANKVARNMQDILEINRQTTAGTQQTASSIKELADVASDLKSSVSGFKL